jgi:hypothetical protein
MRHLLELLLPGVRWLTPGGFLVGLAEAFLWGIYAALVLVPVVNVFLLKHREQRRLHARHAREHGHRAAA